jgi:hypothetical protein
MYYHRAPGRNRTEPPPSYQDGALPMSYKGALASFKITQVFIFLQATWLSRHNYFRFGDWTRTSVCVIQSHAGMPSTHPESGLLAKYRSADYTLSAELLSGLSEPSMHAFNFVGGSGCHALKSTT